MAQPGTARPEESVTRPVISPGVWAFALMGESASRTYANNTRRRPKPEIWRIISRDIPFKAVTAGWNRRSRSIGLHCVARPKALARSSTVPDRPIPLRLNTLGWPDGVGLGR